ncbi:MAG: PAS domain S-box protein [Nitrospinae bacterium]|nr:PAS domain S-box protein [Nitrospinota bacterium]MBL7021168.1 PAS domain S-box protein [Nitrospinaceae bacterium]
MKENLATQLQLILAGNLESLRIWADAIKLDAQVLSRQPEINKKLVSLLTLAQPDSVTVEELRQSSELAWLRKHLGADCKTYGFIGFVVFDLTGLQVGALLEEPVGTRQLLEKSDFYYRSRQGDTVISQPFAGEIALPDEQGVFQANRPTMFVSISIHNSSGDAVGVLAFRLRPEKEFNHILSISRFGETGETYAFNDEGLLVSHSRFDDQLISAGLLQPGVNSIFNIQVRDPGRNLTIKKLRSDEDISKQPFTEMLVNAIQQKPGSRVDGYNDYRGVSVVGAWAWVPELDIGLATELDVAEAFRPLKTLMIWFLSLFGLLLFFGVTASLLRSRYAKSQQQTLENEKRLRSYLDSAFDSIICIDTCGIIQSVNPAVEKQFGYTTDELLGKNVRMLMPEPYHSEHDGYLQTYLNTGKRHIINMMREVTARKKNGTLFPMELSVSESVVRGEKSYMGIIRDISERKAAEKELKQAYAKLEDRISERTEELWQSKNMAEQNNQAKSEFLARMSHELRTPMNAILGFAQLMQESTKDPLPNAHQKRTKQILKAGTHLLELINEVLSLASIEAGKITISLEPVCIADLVEEVLTVVCPLSQNFNIDLIDQITFNKKIYVLADKTRLTQVLLNLLSNGIKYNRKGGSVTLSTQLEKGSRLRINISDTGMGIPEEKLDQLFAPFNRLGAENGDIEGTGIGMTISKKLIEVMNGAIGVESIVGEGSTFYIQLPVCQVQPSISESIGIPVLNDETMNKSDIQSFTLLYIEDNPANLELIKDILSEYPEIKLLTATHAETGLDMARALKPNLILMDINLPDIDGIEALKRLKNFEETHATPVIALSANAMKKDIDRARAEGFKTYFTKPVDIAKFRNFIEEELKNAEISQQETGD